MIGVALFAMVPAFVSPPNSMPPEPEQELSRRQLLPLLGLACLPLSSTPCDAEAIWRSLPGESEDLAEAYPGRFVAYLTRFLLNFDTDFQNLWKSAKESEVSMGPLQSREFQRNARFARFSRTVQLSLSNFAPDKSKRLLEVLLKDYGNTTEAKRQICILFSLLQGPNQQPVSELRRLLRSVENASVSQVDVVDGGNFSLRDGAQVKEVMLELPTPPGLGGRPAKIYCQLKAVNATIGSTILCVDSVVVASKGSGYARDMDFTPKVLLPENLTMERAPNFTVQLTRPSRFPRERAKEALADELKSKELAFVTTKFLIFDSLREALLFFVPAFVEAQPLLIACFCGALAGACGAITSHPIDTIFALRTTGGGTEIPSLDKLFRGVGARVLIYSPGIALTFLVYDAAKTYFGVGGNALMQTLDLLRPS